MARVARAAASAERVERLRRWIEDAERAPAPRTIAAVDLERQAAEARKAAREALLLEPLAAEAPGKRIDRNDDGPELETSLFVEKRIEGDFVVREADSNREVVVAATQEAAIAEAMRLKPRASIRSK